MQLLFVRHGQGEHTLDPPQSLQLHDAPLTTRGIQQAKRLAEQFPLSNNDIVVVSPLRRTIQTALIWKEKVSCKLIIHPAIGPRMFPLLDESQTHRCDIPLRTETIQSEYSGIPIIDCPHTTWSKGINAIPENLFQAVAGEFIDWCVSWHKKRIHVVSHDGTITSYRRFLGEKQVTREDFLGECGWHLCSVHTENEE